MNIVTEIQNSQNAGGTDLSNYYAKSESDNLLNAKQDLLNTSSNLQINYLNTGSLDVKALASSDQSMSMISGGQTYDNIIYLAIPFSTKSPSKKCPLIG